MSTEEVKKDIIEPKKLVFYIIFNIYKGYIIIVIRSNKENDDKRIN